MVLVSEDFRTKPLFTRLILQLGRQNFRYFCEKKVMKRNNETVGSVVCGVINRISRKKTNVVTSVLITGEKSRFSSTSATELYPLFIKMPSYR